MLRPEALWLRRALALLPLARGATLLNVGSSTGSYRRLEQPWVENDVFAPLLKRGIAVVHLDLKPAEGVDVVGDLVDPVFRAKALAGKSDVVLCSNLLEHVSERDALCAAMQEVVPSTGYLIVTCPYRYPYHPDPIDTMFRPTVTELADLFPDLSLAWGEVVVAEFQWSYFAHYEKFAGRGAWTSSAQLAASSLHDSKERRRFKELFIRTSATCIVLRRE